MQLADLQLLALLGFIFGAAVALPWLIAGTWISIKLLRRQSAMELRVAAIAVTLTAALVFHQAWIAIPISLFGFLGLAFLIRRNTPDAR